MTHTQATGSSANNNPLFNSNRLKLGVFGLNAGYHIFSAAPERFLADWDRADIAVGMADIAAFASAGDTGADLDHRLHRFSHSTRAGIRLWCVEGCRAGAGASGSD